MWRWLWGGGVQYMVALAANMVMLVAGFLWERVVNPYLGASFTRSVGCGTRYLPVETPDPCVALDCLNNQTLPEPGRSQQDIFWHRRQQSAHAAAPSGEGSAAGVPPVCAMHHVAEHTGNGVFIAPYPVGMSP